MMLESLTFTKSHWLGNQWKAIDIEPVDVSFFLPLLTYLAQHYAFSMPVVVDKITGYFADFEVFDVQATIDIDADDFSIAFANAHIRDRVFTDLSS